MLRFIQVFTISCFLANVVNGFKDTYRGADIVVSVERSSAINMTSMRKVSCSLKTMVSQFEIGTGVGQIRMGMTSFGMETHNSTVTEFGNFSYESYSSQSTLKSGISTFVDKISSATISRSMSDAYSKLMSDTRKGAQKLYVYMGSGYTTQNDDINYEVDRMLKAGIKIMAVSVTGDLDGVAGYTLRQMYRKESKITTKVIDMSNMEFELYDIIRSDQNCLQTVSECPIPGTDIIFGLEVSSRMNQTWMGKVIVQLKSIVNRFDIGTRDNYIRIGVVPFGAQAYGMKGGAFSYDVYNSKAELTTALATMQTLMLGKSKISSAISGAYGQLMKSTRNDADKIYIYMGTGLTTADDDVKTEINKMEEAGIKVISMVVTPSPTTSQLYMMRTLTGCIWSRIVYKKTDVLAEKFEALVRNPRPLPFIGCGYRGADIIVGLETTSRIDEALLNTIKSKVIEMATDLNIGTAFNQVRIGVVPFDTKVLGEDKGTFGLDKYSTLNGIKSGMDMIGTSSGDAVISASLVDAYNRLTTSNNRKDADKVYIYMGTGVTKQNDDVKAEVTKMMNAGIKVLSVSVSGDLNQMFYDNNKLSNMLNIDLSEEVKTRFTNSCLGCKTLDMTLMLGNYDYSDLSRMYYMKQMASHIVDNLNIGTQAGQSRVAALTYNHKINVDQTIAIHEYTDSNTNHFKSAIKRLDWKQSGPRNVVGVFTETVQMVKNYTRAGARKVIVIFDRGTWSQYPEFDPSSENLAIEIRKAREVGIKVYFVQFGAPVTGLATIQSVIGDPTAVIQVEDYDDKGKTAEKAQELVELIDSKCVME